MHTCGGSTANEIGRRRSLVLIAREERCLERLLFTVCRDVISHTALTHAKREVRSFTYGLLEHETGLAREVLDLPLLVVRRRA
jgi:hypothetical protein